MTLDNVGEAGCTSGHLPMSMEVNSGYNAPTLGKFRFTGGVSWPTSHTAIIGECMEYRVIINYIIETCLRHCLVFICYLLTFHSLSHTP